MAHLYDRHCLANRGEIAIRILYAPTHFRSLSGVDHVSAAELHMNWLCKLSPSIRTKIVSLLIETRCGAVFFGLYRPAIDAAGLQADEAYLVGKGLTPVAAYLAQEVRKHYKLSSRS